MACLDVQTSWHFRFHKPLLRRMRMAIGIRKPVSGSLCRLSVPLLLGPRKRLNGEGADAVAAVGQHRDRWVDRLPRRAEPLGKPGRRRPLLAVDQAEVPGPAVLRHGLADADLKVALLVVPVPDVAAVKADDDRILPLLGISGTGLKGVSLGSGRSRPRSASWRAATRCRWRRMVQALAVLPIGRISLSNWAVAPQAISGAHLVSR
jgi:hypothetical protein